MSTWLNDFSQFVSEKIENIPEIVSQQCQFLLTRNFSNTFSPSK